MTATAIPAIAPVLKVGDEVFNGGVVSDVVVSVVNVNTFRLSNVGLCTRDVFSVGIQTLPSRRKWRKTRGCLLAVVDVITVGGFELVVIGAGGGVVVAEKCETINC